VSDFVAGLHRRSLGLVYNLAMHPLWRGRFSRGGTALGVRRTAWRAAGAVPLRQRVL